MLKSAAEQRPVCVRPARHSWLFIQYLVMYQPLSNQTAPNTIVRVYECVQCGRIRLEAMVEDGLTP